MAIKEKARHQIPMDFSRLEHSDQWRSDDEWLPWPYLCPRVKRTGPGYIVPYGQSAEIVPGLFGLIEFVRENLQASIATDRLKTAKQAWERYVALERHIPEVWEVSVSDDSEETTIWTIICTADFNKTLRSQVYKPQIEVLRASQSPMVKLRLLNLHDIPANSRDQMLPRSSRRVFERDGIRA